MSLLVVELPETPPPALFDGALALALATGATLRMPGPFGPAEADLIAAAVKLGTAEDAASKTARASALAARPFELSFLHVRAGAHVLELPAPGAVARALTAFAWPLALLGRPSELRLLGPNHCEGAATFHDLRLAWVPLAERFGLRVSLELPAAGFDDAEGELIAELDPAPALTPLQLAHRGLLRQVTVVAASAGAHDEPLRAAARAARRLRAHGIIAEAERVPLPLAGTQGARGRWALTAIAEFERSFVSASALAPVGDHVPPRLPRARAAVDDDLAEGPGERVAERLAAFLSRRGAVDAALAERLLVPAIFCAAGLGARAGPPPTCHFTTSEVTPALLQLATLAPRVLPVRTAVDGELGEEGMIAVAPQT